VQQKRSKYSVHEFNVVSLKRPSLLVRDSLTQLQQIRRELEGIDKYARGLLNRFWSLDWPEDVRNELGELPMLPDTSPLLAEIAQLDAQIREWYEQRRLAEDWLFTCRDWRNAPAWPMTFEYLVLPSYGAIEYDMRMLGLVDDAITECPTDLAAALLQAKDVLGRYHSWLDHTCLAQQGASPAGSAAALTTRLSSPACAGSRRSFGNIGLSAV
jgi:hypothetical protein